MVRRSNVPFRQDFRSATSRKRATSVRDALLLPVGSAGMPEPVRSLRAQRSGFLLMFEEPVLTVTRVPPACLSAQRNVRGTTMRLSPSRCELFKEPKARPEQHAQHGIGFTCVLLRLVQIHLPCVRCMHLANLIISKLPTTPSTCVGSTGRQGSSD